MSEAQTRTDAPSIIAMLIVITAVTVALGAMTELGALWSGVIAVASGIVAAAITHAVVLQRRRARREQASRG
ncbi:MAG: hypothetical protein ACQEWM_08070 [Actinomycetota bacterium]